MKTKRTLALVLSRCVLLQFPEAPVDKIDPNANIAHYLGIRPRPN
jgi:hypothetical protein